MMRYLVAAILLLIAVPAWSAPPVTVIISPETVNVSVSTEADNVRIDDGSTVVNVSTPADEIMTVITPGEQGPPGPAGVCSGECTGGGTGTNGREVELRNNGTYVQWRYVGDSTWIDLIALSAIIGPEGVTGATGADGHSPVLTWSGDQIAIDGSVAGPHLTGPQGDPGLDGPSGPRGTGGPAGMPGSAATIAVGTVASVGPNGNVSITNSGTSSAAVFDFILKQGPQGQPGSNGTNGSNGAAATVAVGTVTTTSACYPATITNSGTSSAAVFDFVLPRGYDGHDGATGPANTLAIGTVSTVNYPGSATATITGSAPNQTLNLGLPQGAPGSNDVTRAFIAGKLQEASDTVIHIVPATNSGTAGGLSIDDQPGNTAILLRNGAFEVRDTSGVTIAKIDRSTRAITMYYSSGNPGFSWSPTTGAVFQ